MTATMETLGDSRELIEAALREAVARLDADTRRVVSYHLGWCDEHGVATTGNGGKAIRSALVLLAAEAVGGQASDAVPGAVAVELVHNFSLVHDDLMDGDVERRHRATVWSLWGDATAILAGDAMLSLAHEVLLESGSPHAVAAGTIVARATRELIRGQVQDLAFENRDDVTVAECIDMAAGKTGSLLAASAAIGAVLAGAPQGTVDALSAYGSHVGLAFQLIDDILGIWGRPEVTGKPVHSDLRSGKKSLPVTWAIENGRDAGHELAAWLASDSPRTDADVRHAAELVVSSGARAWAESEAERRVHLAQMALDQVHIADTHRQRLGELAHFIVDREM